MAELHGLDREKKGAASTPRKGRRSVPWRQDLAILARLDVVAAMMLRGARSHQIAEAMEYSASTAKRDVNRVKKLWLEETRAGVNESRARSVAQLREVQQRAWQEYDRRANARYLRLVIECEKEIVSLEGSRPAVGIDLTSKGRELRHLTAEELSDDELAAIAAGGGRGTAGQERGS